MGGQAMGINVILVDDHGVVRAGIRSILEAEPDIEVIGEAADGWRALQAVKDHPEVDVMVLDLAMPRLGGMEVLRRALELKPGLSVLVVSMYGESQYAPALLAQGAAGFICKDDADIELVQAVRTVARGRSFFSRTVERQTEVESVRLPHEGLSPREIQVFMLLIEGRQVSGIAAELGLSKSTVSTYVGFIKSKLGAESIAEIVHYAYRHGLIETP